MGTIMNPILEKTLDLLRDGRVPEVISPEKTTAPNKKVTFVFEDGSEDVLETEADARCEDLLSCRDPAYDGTIHEADDDVHFWKLLQDAQFEPKGAIRYSSEDV